MGRDLSFICLKSVKKDSCGGVYSSEYKIQITDSIDNETRDIGRVYFIDNRVFAILFITVSVVYSYYTGVSNYGFDADVINSHLDKIKSVIMDII